MSDRNCPKCGFVSILARGPVVEYDQARILCCAMCGRQWNETDTGLTEIDAESGVSGVDLIQTEEGRRSMRRWIVRTPAGIGRILSVSDRAPAGYYLVTVGYPVSNTFKANHVFLL